MSSVAAGFGLGGSTSPFGGSNVHLDVLGAAPDADDSKLALVEELKRRARGSIGARNYPEADLLYIKAVETLLSVVNDINNDKDKELAILYTNRSLVRYNLQKVDASVHDARQATLLDPAYVKAHWRLGQGLAKQKLFAEALKAYQIAAKLESNNKALQKEMELTRQKLLLLNEDNQTAPVDDNDVSAVPTTTATAKNPNASRNNHKQEKTADDDEVIKFTQSEPSRGYKIVDGKKTSYFHREISEEEKRLIGDIAPKKLDQMSIASGGTNNSNHGAPAVVEGTSVWNTAGTWEEKDVTQWATDTLRAALLTTKYTLPSAASTSTSTIMCASITKVSTLSGHASVATVRGKRRYIYEFAVTIEWSLPLTSSINDDELGAKKICRGTLSFPDVDGTCDGEYDVSDYTVFPESPPEARHLLDRYIKNDGLRHEITKTLNDWVKVFEATYSI